MTAEGVGDEMAIRVARTAFAVEVTDRPARAYLAALGWMGTRPARTTWADLRRRHGRAVRAVRAAITARDAGGPAADIYEAKNRSFTLGLDVTLAHMGDLYRAVLEATLPAFARGPSPRAILDLGCDNGVLTCAYALAFPAARVVGVDCRASGVARARELATLLEIDNVSFAVADLAEAGEVAPAGTIDLAISTCRWPCYMTR